MKPAGFEPARGLEFWSQLAKCDKYSNAHVINTRMEFWSRISVWNTSIRVSYIYIFEILTRMSLICTWNCAPFARSGCATANLLNFPRIDILEFWFQNRPGLRPKSLATFYRVFSPRAQAAGLRYRGFYGTIKTDISCQSETKVHLG